MFTSLDDFKSKVFAEQQRLTRFFRGTFSSSGVIPPGDWIDSFQGNSGYSGSAGVAAQLDASSAGSLNSLALPSGTRLFSFGIGVNGNQALGHWLVDLLLYYPGLVVTGSPTALDNTLTLPRYATGEGVMAALVVTSALGAAGTQLTFTYTNQAGTGSRTSQTVNSATGTSRTSQLMNGSGPFVGLQSGDRGIRSVESYTIDAGATTGTVALILFKPIALFSYPPVLSYVPTEHELALAKATLPEVLNGSCLNLISLTAGNISTAAYVGYLDFVWGT